mmetsp:Transcript_9193/g.6952  ORF Transcript_9193/g.6952 Transcript_9193/m.6952 type:complete len:155 (-) Transcript_9193:1455-1919(-)
MAVPEGLPLAVSLSVAFSLDAMKADSLLIKNTEALETLGMVDSICSGKTSTLTTGQMSVHCYVTCGKFIDKPQILLDNSQLDRSLNNSELFWKLPQTVINKDVLAILIDAIIYNSEARVEMSLDARYEPEGNPIEAAMLRFLQENDYEVHHLLV